MSRLHEHVKHSPFPAPSADEVLTTIDPEEVRAEIGFTYATVFQDDQLVPGFALTRFQRDRGSAAERASDGSSSHTTPEPPSTSSSQAPPARQTRSVFDSWVQLKVPLSTNTTFRRAFQDVDGSARVGRILELADGLAADVGYRHTVGGYKHGVDVTVATASIYSMVLGGREFTDCDDILLRAFITRVGSSSMEVCVEIEQVTTATRSQAFFVMVVLDHATNTAKTVPHIAHVPDAIASQAAQRQERRQRVRSDSTGMGNALSEKDLRDLHSLWSVYRDRAASASDVSSSSLQHSKVRLQVDERLMADNRLESTLLIWPNEMNVHGTLFGGIVTRTAIEIAYMTVAQYLHSTAWAMLLAVDDVFFLKPIPSGAMTKYLGQVIYTEGAQVVVRVECLLVPPRQHPAAWQLGTVFFFHFRWNPVVPRVVPQSYEEYLLYMEGRRRLHDYRPSAKL